MFDVILIGGGPAGLSIGSILSKKLKVLIVEKEKCGRTTRSWATWEANAKHLPIFHKAKRGVFSSYRGAEVENKDALTYTVNDGAILKTWLKKCRKNRAKIIDGCTFKSYRLFKDHVKVKTSKGVFEGKLLVDATGSESSIVKKKYGHKEDHYWSCFGYVAEHESMDPARALILEDVLPEKPRPYFMYFPISKNKGVPIVFFLGSKKYDKPFLKKKFLEVIHSKEYSKKFIGAKWLEEKFGYIPLRRNPIKNLDRVVFVGDAASWAPPLTGCGFNMIMEKHKQISTNIFHLFKTNNFSKDTINNLMKLTKVEEENYILQSIMYYLVLNFKDKDLNKLIAIMHGFNMRYEEEFIRSHLSSSEIRTLALKVAKSFALKDIIRAIPRREYVFLLKCLEEVEEDLLFLEAHRWFHKLKGKI